MNNMDFILSQLAEILVPLGIVVVLPVLIVWLDMRKKANDTNKRTEIVLAAIEKNSDRRGGFLQEDESAAENTEGKTDATFSLGNGICCIGSFSDRFCADTDSLGRSCNQ